MEAPTPSDDTLVRYLLGDLPAPHAETLDERSIVDAEFAERLRAVEHDLADAYARGELSAEDRGRWQEHLGASAGGRQDLILARALAARQQIAPAASRSLPRWTIGLAAAALLVLVAGVAYLRAPAPGATIGGSLPAAPAAPPAAAQAAPAPTLSLIALTLPAPKRDGATVPLLEIPRGTTDVRVTLELEPADFARYAVTLRNASARGAVWQATDLAPDSSGASLHIVVPAGTFRRGLFVFDVDGLGRGSREPIGSYPVRIKEGQ